MTNDVVVLSDTHLGKNPYFSMDLAVDAYKIAIDHAAKSSYRLVVNGGDLFDKSTVGAAELNAFGTICSYAKENEVDLLIVEGNHGLDNSDRSIIAHYQSYDLSHIHVATNKAIGYKYNDVLIVLSPYGTSIQDALSIRTRNPEGKSILVAHTDVVAAKYDSGALSSVGLTPDSIEHCLKYFNIVALGHIHLPQYINNTKNCFYIGATLQYNFNSVGQLDRGYVSIDMESMIMTRHPLVGDKWPKFIKGNWDDIQNIEELKDSYTKVIVNVDENASNEQIRDSLISKGVKEKYLQVVREQPVLEITKRSDIRISDNPRIMANKYIRTKLKDPKEIEKSLDIHDELLKEIHL